MNTTTTIRRHIAAFRNPRTPGERAMVNGIRMLQDLEESHRATCEDPIADDYITGERFLQLAQTLHSMLECINLGRLDASELQGAIDTVLNVAGYPKGALYMTLADVYPD